MLLRKHRSLNSCISITEHSNASSHKCWKPYDALCQSSSHQNKHWRSEQFNAVVLERNQSMYQSIYQLQATDKSAIRAIWLALTTCSRCRVVQSNKHACMRSGLRSGLVLSGLVCSVLLWCHMCCDSSVTTVSSNDWYCHQTISAIDWYILHI